MSSLRHIFWPPRSDESTPRSRLTLHRRRRTEPTVPTSQSLDEPGPASPTLEPSEVVPHTESEGASATENVPAVQPIDEIETEDDDSTGSEHCDQPSATSETAGRSARSSISQPQRGSNRLKGIFARLRKGKSQGQSEGSESAHPLQLPDVRDADVVADPTESAPRDLLFPLSRHPSALGPEAVEQQQRSVSTQTAETHDSENTSATVYRHSSQRTQPPVLEFQQDFFSSSFFDDCSQETRHLAEPSDPFSDKKNVEVTAKPVTRAPSKRSSKLSSKLSNRSSTIHERSKRMFELPQDDEDEITPAPLVPSRHQSTYNPSRRGSGTIWVSFSSRLEPTKAAKGFNVLADQLHIRVLLDEGGTNIESKDTPAIGKSDKDSASIANTRDRFFRRVRPVQSSREMDALSQSSAPMLRRTKTFANLTRRHVNPMSSLRGRSLESMARLGGHSYLVWGTRLIPGPLQLPACIVAMIQYLRKYGPNIEGLFYEPRDLRAAYRLYDYFAGQILDGEKEENKISIHLRTISMPQWDGEASAEQTLTVASTLRAFLMGLPGGLLGSTRLFEVLDAIQNESLTIIIQDGPRVQLLTFAIIALTTEMERALICATLGLLTFLQQTSEEPALSEVPEPGNPLRRVASLQNLDYFARAFGPTLLGDYQQEQCSTEMPKPKGYLVMRILLENWPGVNRQLREWSAGSGGTKHE